MTKTNVPFSLLWCLGIGHYADYAPSLTAHARRLEYGVFLILPLSGDYWSLIVLGSHPNA